MRVWVTPLHSHAKVSVHAMKPSQAHAPIVPVQLPVRTALLTEGRVPHSCAAAIEDGERDEWMNGRSRVLVRGAGLKHPCCEVVRRCVALSLSHCEQTTNERSQTGAVPLQPLSPHTRVASPPAIRWPPMHCEYTHVSP